MPGETITLLTLRDRYGIGTTNGRPGFMNQDWWENEPFASVPLPDPVPEIPTVVRDDLRGRWPAHITIPTPLAVVAAWKFFDHWERTGHYLWADDFIWCSDRDSHGDRVYIGGYSRNRPGLEVHRHLTLTRRHTFLAL